VATYYYWHPVCLTHVPGPHHPESPERLKSVWAALSRAKFDGLKKIEAPEASPEIIAL